MREASVDKRELERLVEQFDAAPEVIAEAKRKAFEAAAPKLKALVDKGFRDTGLRERTGKVLSWQQSYVGTGGGYTAVRPLSETFTETTRAGKRYAVGHVTNAIVSGHEFPAPSGKNRRYRQRIKSGKSRVSPYPFYDRAREGAHGLAAEIADDILQTMKDHFEG